MMRRFIILLFILLFSVWLGIKISEDPGYAFFAYKNWTVQMPLWFLVISSLVMIAILYFILRLFDGIDASFVGWKNWLRARKRHQAYNKTSRGLIELMEGHWVEAETLLLQGLDQSDAPLVNYLAAAKAAHEEKAYDRRDTYLRQAHGAAPHAEIAIGLTQAQLQLKQGQLEQALATLDHLRRLAPKHAMVLKLLERVYTHLGDWKNLLELVPELRKAKILTAEQEIQLTQRIYIEMLNKTKDPLTLDSVWKTIPRKFQHMPDIVFCLEKKKSDTASV